MLLTLDFALICRTYHLCSGRRKVSLVVSSPIVFGTGHIIAELVVEKESDRKFQEGVAQNLQALHIPPEFELQ